MGKYNDSLAALREQRQAMISLHRHVMNSYDSFMTDEARRYNQQNHDTDLYLLDREISQIEPLAIKELVQEAIDEIINGVGEQSYKLRDALEKALNDAIKDFEKGK